MEAHAGAASGVTIFLEAGRGDIGIMENVFDGRKFVSNDVADHKPHGSRRVGTGRSLSCQARG